MPITEVTKITECLVCRGPVNYHRSYPQLCLGCHDKPKSLLISELSRESEQLTRNWGRLVTADLEERFMIVLTAAAELSAPMSWLKRNELMEKFKQRIGRTVERGDDFAKLIAVWWTARIRADDLRALRLQLAYLDIEEAKK